MKNPSVLITDADLKVSLPILRSLAKKNIEIGAGASDGRAISFFSKYCMDKFLYPSPRENVHIFLKVLEKIVKATHFDILFPVGEWTLVPISENREKIAPHIKLSIGHKEAIKSVFEKSRTVKLAITEDVPIPKTFFIDNIQDLTKASKKLSYPAVIKSRESWVWNKNETFFSRPTYVNSPQELLEAYKTVHGTFPFPMIQEYIPGTPYHIGVLCNHSRLRAFCCIKEHRTIPVTGGYASFRETVSPLPKMKEFAMRLLQALEWHGVAEVEFKLDSRDGMLKFMEINGRFWGSLELAIVSGVDFPYLLYKMIVDGDVKPVFNYKSGVKRRWMEGDLIHLSNVLKQVDKHDGIEYPEKWRTVAKFLKSSNRGIDCFYWDDLLPFLSRFLWGDIPRIALQRLQRTTRIS